MRAILLTLGLAGALYIDSHTLLWRLTMTGCLSNYQNLTISTVYVMSRTISAPHSQQPGRHTTIGATRDGRFMQSEQRKAGAGVEKALQ